MFTGASTTIARLGDFILHQEIALSNPIQQACPSPGHVIWITGLAGAGKTTLAKCLYALLKERLPSLILLDGDSLREVFGSTLSYTLEDRLQLAMKYGRLCQLLASQGLHVICSTISMFDKCREWNRSHLANYFEIYVRVPFRILQQRDQKSLYSQASEGKITNVIGLDLPFEEPKNPDLIVDNHGQTSPQDLCNYILKSLPIKGLK